MMSQKAIKQFDQPLAAIDHLVNFVQNISACRDLDSVMAHVRTAARELTGADGASFVLKDGDYCFYADEDAVSPLWKGQRFKQEVCVSGWVMKNRQIALIPDIFTDSRVPIDAYSPTFVRSLVMVPIRTNDPIGAIGAYWAKKRTATAEEIQILQALADTTAVAMENLQLYSDLQSKVLDLRRSNSELARFAWMAAHDFKSPLRNISLSMGFLEGEAGAKLTPEELQYVKDAEQGAHRLYTLIEKISEYLNIDEGKEKFEKISIRAAIDSAAKEIIEKAMGDSIAQLSTSNNFPEIYGNFEQMTQVFRNIFSNAVKYNKNEMPDIQVRCSETDREWIIEIRDNGIGIEKPYLDRIFGLFQKLHPHHEFAGTGIGLAICRKIIERHNGRIWAESKFGEGSRFFIALPKFRFS